MQTLSTPSLQRAPSLTAATERLLADRIRDGTLTPGVKLPREADLMAEFGVSRTVVREAISRLQAAGMVETRHGIGSFVVGMGDTGAFRVSADQLGTLQDVIAVLELRIAVETESASLAAQRRTPENLAAITAAAAAFGLAVDAGRDTIGPDFQFHLEIARATQNERFTDLMNTLGGMMIPRARLGGEGDPASAQRLEYLRNVHVEHQAILTAIERQDPDAARAAMRTHLGNSRERRRRLLEPAR